MASRLHAYIGTFRQLEILLAVYEHGSITVASENLYLTQPTVSMQLKKLSDSIGIPLYDQVGRKLKFTAAGNAVIAAAREILDKLDNLDMHLADLKGLKAGKLRLGVVTTSKYFIPHLIGDFCRRYPDIDIELKVANREQIIDRLLEGKDDFNVFSHPPKDQHIALHEFLPNPLVAIAPQNHPLSRSRQISLKEFARHPFLMREKGSGTRHAIEEFMRKQGITLNIRMTIESNEAIKQAVISGLGTSILSSHTLAFGGREGLGELKVSRLPIQTNWHLAHLKAKRLSVVANTFLEYVNTVGQSRLLKLLRK